MTGRRFSVELADIRMTDFEDNKPTGSSVGFYVVRQDLDSTGRTGLFIIDDYRYMTI